MPGQSKSTANSTLAESLHDYFSQFGEVQECTVMRDGATGRSRGFGFLTFKDPKTVNTVMVKEHFLDGKIVRPARDESNPWKQFSLGSRRKSPEKKAIYLHCGSQIDPKRAIPRDEQEKTSKIFVGGVSQEASEADFTSFFEQFGRVIDATLMMDKDTGRPRGFGFVTFDSEAAVERCLDYHPLEIMGKSIEVKKAQPRGKMGEEEEGPRGRGRGKFGRDDRFGNDNNQVQGNQQQGAMGAGGMTPQMMAQYWQRMQQYFALMQSQMAATAMGGGMGMTQMNPQMMAQMQQQMQMQQMQKQYQGGQSPAPQSPGGSQMPNMQNMNPMQQQQMMQQMMQMQQGGNMNNNMNAPSGPAAARSGFSAAEQQAFEQQKYEQQVRRGGGPPHGPRGSFTQNASQSPQSWEGMYDDAPQPNESGRGSAGVVRNLTPSNAGGRGKITPTPQPSAAPANAPTGPKNAGKPGSNFRGGGGRGGGRFHPYGRG